jgi:hypothetical protein
MKLRHRKIMDMRLPHQKWLDQQPIHTQEWLKKQAIWHDRDMVLATSIALVVGFVLGWIV